MADLLLLAVFWGGVAYLLIVLVGRQRERKLDEARAAEARFRDLTELSADWFWETDAEHRLTWVAGGAPLATFFGMTPTYGKRFWEIARVEVSVRALRVHEERLSRQLPFDLEIARTDERGARQIHVVSGRVRRDAGGRFLGYRGVGRDVTLERRTELGLAQAKERLELALEGGDLAEWHYHPQSDELIAGSGWLRFVGHDRAPPLARGADFAGRVHEEDAPRVRAALVRALKGEARELDVDMRIRLEGGWKWLHARGRVVERDEAGRAVRLSGVVTDIDERRRGEAAKSAAESRWRSLVELAPEGILVHAGGVIEYANPIAARLLKASGPQDLAGASLETLVHPEELESHRRRQAFVGAAPGFNAFVERRLRCLDGTYLWAEVGSVSYLEEGRVVVQTLIRDATERRRAREELAERERRFHDVAEAAGEYVWETDAEGRFTYLSERVEAVTGYARSEILGRRPAEFMPLGENRSVEEWLAKHAAGHKPFRDLLVRSITRSGAAIWQSVSGVPRHDPQGAWLGYRGTAADVTARKQAEARIEYLGTRDPLTGLANRSLLTERGEQAVRAAAQARSQIALLCIDLDRFKLVNAAMGHAAGDVLLRAVGERLHNALRREDTLARLGGDRFVLLWNGLRSRDEARLLAQRLAAVLGRPFTVEGRTLNAAASIGIALYPDDGRDFGELLSHADAALAHAKDCGGGSSRFYEPELGAQAGERLRLENDLRGALARSELILHWQPVVSGRVHGVRGRGELVGAEALVRWRHPERGLVSPEDFVPLAERSGLIGAVGEWTLERALSQAGAWQGTLPGKPWFALNVTAQELAQGDAFYRRLKSSLEANRIDGERVELEVTERVLMADADHNVQALRRIGELGVRLAIDDFGTGYSSLAYLRGLPVDKLKIDRAFLRGIEDDPAALAIVRTVVSLGRTLGVAVAAEGVESAAQLERLLEAGCNHWQGHYFSEPVDAAAFEALAVSSAGEAPTAARK